MPTIDKLQTPSNMSRCKANVVAAILNADIDDDWTYVPAETSAGWEIHAYDEDGDLIGPL